MSTAASSDARIRQIAILVSIVDSAAAQHLLLHLPTETARRVRAMAANLGPISAQEKQQILSAFQQSAAVSASPDVSESRAASALTAPSSTPRAPELNPSGRLGEYTSAESEESPQSAAPWTRLGTETLLRFVRGERPAVAAVVVSQLPTKVAVAILSELEPQLSSDIIRRLSRLQDIDPEAKAAIDEHLAERLGEQQQKIESEIANTKRIQALLNEAPHNLRAQWQDALDLPASQLTAQDMPPERAVPEPISAPLSNEPAPVRAEPSLAELYGNAAITTADVSKPHAAPPSSPASPQAEPEEDDSGRDDATLLPFPTSPAAAADHTFDRSLSQLEFERILELPPESLAALLSNMDSETVLLSLAGATPQFMERFYRMLDRRDAKALDRRLKQIGPMQIRDIDEAQRRVVEGAESLALPAQANSAAPLQRAA